MRLSVQGKGAGMISPNFATLLVFVQTDARARRRGGRPAARRLRQALVRPDQRRRPAVDLDTIIILPPAPRGSRIEPETSDERTFGEALDATLRQLALMVARDGEGARRVGRVVVARGDQRVVERVAHAVADSPLVKTALYGGDPNWGRIIQAVGAALPDTAPLAVDIAIEGIQVCARGALQFATTAALCGRRCSATR